MKTTFYYSVLALASFFIGACTDKSLDKSSLKGSLDISAQELATAVNKISSSDGYQVLAVNETETDSPSKVISGDFIPDSTYNSIMLTDIAGVYDYRAVPYNRNGLPLLRFFTKTAESEFMIVRLPEEKVKNPRVLMQFSPADTSLVNDYIITLTEYEYNFNRYLGWDYKMASSINIKDVDAGLLKINSSNSRSEGYKYTSEFVFADGYTANCKFTTGDTVVSLYAITDGTKILFEEKYSAIRTSLENRHREREYSLTIGNVQVVRKPGKNSLDSAKVYLDGVLQINALIEIVTIENTSDEGTENTVINKKRDIKITFDDGTSVTVRELIGPSIETIRTLFATLRKASFSTAIIDRIAWGIYIHRE
jgi:hypothetical protein